MTNARMEWPSAKEVVEGQGPESGVAGLGHGLEGRQEAGDRSEGIDPGEGGIPAGVAREVPRFSQVTISERRVRAESTSEADSPAERARIASRAPRGVLRLDGQQPSGDLLSTARRVATEQLRRASLRGHRLILGARGRP